MATKTTAEQKFLRNTLAMTSDPQKIAEQYRARFKVDLPVADISRIVQSNKSNPSKAADLIYKDFAAQFVTSVAPAPKPAANVELKPFQDKANDLVGSYKSIGNKSAGIEYLTRQYSDYAKQYGENDPRTKAFADTVYAKLPDLGRFQAVSDDNPYNPDFGLLKDGTNIFNQLKQQEQADLAARQAAEAERDRQKAAEREADLSRLRSGDLGEMFKSGNLFLRSDPTGWNMVQATPDALRAEVLRDLEGAGFKTDTWVGQENLLEGNEALTNALRQGLWARTADGSYEQLGSAFANPIGFSQGERSRSFTGVTDASGNPIQGIDIGGNFMLYDPAGTGAYSGGEKYNFGMQDVDSRGALGDLAPLVSIGLGLAGVPGMIGSALGATGSLATAVGSGVIGAGTSLLGGGDIGDALKSGLLAGGGSYVGGQLLGGGNTVTDPFTGEALNVYTGDIGNWASNATGGVSAALPVDQVGAMNPPQDSSATTAFGPTPSAPYGQTMADGTSWGTTSYPQSGLDSIVNQVVASGGNYVDPFSSGSITGVEGLAPVTPAALGTIGAVTGMNTGGLATAATGAGTATPAFDISKFLTDTFGVSPETAATVASGVGKLGTALGNDPIRAATLGLGAYQFFEQKNAMEEAKRKEEAEAAAYMNQPINQSIVDKYGKVPALTPIQYQPLNYQGFQSVGLPQGLLEQRLGRMRTGLIG